MNDFIRNLIAIRKAYILKSGMRRETYSQFGEDIIINRYFRRQKTGFYVDVGCFHPLKYNNTWLLYKKGWCGINVDIDNSKILLFNKRRPRDKNIACAIANYNGTATFFSNSDYSLTTTLSKKFADDHGATIVGEVNVSKLDDIISKSHWNGRIIDLLSIDVEGLDLEVLKSLDFNIYKPRLVAVETNALTLDDVMISEVYQYLTNRGYKMLAWCGLTIIMSNEVPSY